MVDYVAQIHWYEFSPVVAVKCDNRKAMGKEKWHRTRFEKSTKNDNIEFRKNKMIKWKSNFKLIKSWNVNSYYGEKWKIITKYLITKYLIIIAVIIKIIVKMIVMLMNNNNNNNNNNNISK